MRAPAGEAQIYLESALKWPIYGKQIVASVASAIKRHIFVVVRSAPLHG